MNSPYKGKFRVSQEYKGTSHDGLDLVGVDSKNIYSTTNGVVERAGWENSANKKQGFGQYVRIKQDGSDDRYYFGHLSKINVKVGDKVKIGDLLGVEGNTGYSFGSHCHYCIRGNASKSEIKDVCILSGIPNKIGTYNAITEGWAKDEKGWYYLKANGNRAKNCWQKDSSGWCYLNANGRITTNAWVKDSNGWCYLDENGYAVSDSWKQIDGRWYYFNDNTAVKGFKTIKGKLFYFAKTDGNGLKECQLIVTNANGEIQI